MFEFVYKFDNRFKTKNLFYICSNKEIPYHKEKLISDFTTDNSKQWSQNFILGKGIKEICLVQKTEFFEIKFKFNGNLLMLATQELITRKVLG